MTDPTQPLEGGVPAASPEEATPSGAELVIPPDAERHDVLQVLDRHDEALILEEFQRRALRVMLYDFPMDGKAMIDLSYAGVREAVGLMNRTGKCRIGIVGGPEAQVVEEHEEEHAGLDEDVPPVFVRATVWARDEVTGQVYTGTADEAKFLKGRKGVRWDKFARTKAINKAERNALKKFIPEPMRQTMIAQYKDDQETIRTIAAGAGAEEMAALPPPLDDEEAKALRARAEALWVELREVNPIAKAPGWFHEGLIRVQHSHEGLRGFGLRLEELIRQEREKAGGS